MGLVTATLVKNVRVNVETYVPGTYEPTQDAAKVGEVSVLAGAVAQAIADMDFDITKLVFLYLLSDEDITLTFTCGTTTLEIDLLADIPWVWDDSYEDTIPCPFPANVDSCAAANAGASAATLKFRAGVNA